MSSVTRSFIAPTTGLACGLILVSLTGCSAIDHFTGSEKVDYRTGARQTTGLDVPPDLTQLSQERQNASGIVTATELAAKKSSKPAAGSPAVTEGPVAIGTLGELKLIKSGNERLLRSTATPEQLWPQVRAFWLAVGFEIDNEQQAVGVMETNWLENRAKLPQDFIRRTIGTFLDGVYSTGERDKYRTRLERVDGGTEIYITHRGMQEVYTSQQRDTTAWQVRAADPSLESEMLSRLMLKLGGREDDAKAGLVNLASADSGAKEATKTVVAEKKLSEPAGRSLADVPSSLQLNDSFDMAWRRVGQSLDRHGFTVEDRDRKQGLFFLRYADPSFVGKEEPGFFAKLFGNGKAVTANRYRVLVRADGEHSAVSITDTQGVQQTDDNAKRILQLLQDDLR